MVLKLFIPFFMIFCCIIGCAHKRSQGEVRITTLTNKKSNIKPIWVDTSPNDPYYFYGVGAAFATDNTAEDRKRADDAARIEIASQLKINVSAVVLNIMQYEQEQIGEKSREQWIQEQSEKMYSIVDTTALEGSRIIERWYDRQARIHYSLASMSASEFKDKLKKRIENAQKLSLDQYYCALEEEKSAAIPTALRYYVNALAELSIIEDIPFEVDLNNDGIKELFKSEIKRKIGEIISNLEIKTMNNHQETKFGKPLLRPLVVKVLFREMPVKGIPVLFSFVRGNGELDKNVLTNTAGEAISKIYKAESVGHNIVEAVVDVARIVGTEVLKTSGILEAPKAQFNFLCEAISVLVRISEKNLSVPVFDSYIEQAIVEELIKKDFRVITNIIARKVIDLSDIEDALSGDDRNVHRKGKSLGVDIVIIGSASTRFSGKPMFGVSLCHARATVKVIDIKDGRVLAVRDVSEVKGFANNMEKAGIEALKAAGKQIGFELVEQLHASL